ncbi:MAG TPA: helix-turn-helix domain-containing protein [Kofleriaceae bacterium]|nr:helix-turn-helix domain-containing protein [Kofleriaceae bacterium]
MRHLSPRDLADALGVSESSLKRWVDSGKIVAFRTEGGHRRIALAEAVRFVRETHAPLARPELLGLAEVAAAQRSMLTGSVRLFDFVSEGDVDGARGFLLARYLAGATIAELADGPIREAMEELGEIWRHDSRGIFIEHRATDTCLQAIAHLRNMIDTPTNAPLAIGAAPEDDPYILPAFLATMVTTGAGLRTVNLGADTPLSALEQAVHHHRPRLVWMSATAPINSARARSIQRYFDSLDSTTTVIVGGRHGRALAGRSRNVRYLDTLSELSSVAAQLVA